MEKRARRKFTAEYKAEVVRLVRDGGKTVRQASRSRLLHALPFSVKMSPS